MQHLSKLIHVKCGPMLLISTLTHLFLCHILITFLKGLCVKCSPSWKLGELQQHLNSTLGEQGPRVEDLCGGGIVAYPHHLDSARQEI